MPSRARGGTGTGRRAGPADHRPARPCALPRVHAAPRDRIPGPAHRPGGTPPAAARPHAAIDTELHPCLVHVDPAALEHAVSNLVGNALKWTPPDAAVRVIVENGRLSVTRR